MTKSPVIALSFAVQVALLGVLVLRGGSGTALVAQALPAFATMLLLVPQPLDRASQLANRKIRDEAN